MRLDILSNINERQAKNMEFIDKIFRRNKTKTTIKQLLSLSNQSKTPKDENVLKLLELKKFLDMLLGSNKYIAKSEYLNQIKKYDKSMVLSNWNQLIR